MTERKLVADSGVWDYRWNGPTRKDPWVTGSADPGTQGRAAAMLEEFRRYGYREDPIRSAAVFLSGFLQAEGFPDSAADVDAEAFLRALMQVVADELHSADLRAGSWVTR